MIDKINFLFDKGEFDKGLKMISEVLRANPYDIEALTLKAKVLRHLNRVDESVDTYNSLLNLLPSEAELYAERGLSYHSAKQREMALKDFDKAIELDPKNGYRYASRAFIKNYYGDQLGAIADYDLALELDPQDAISLNNKGMIEENIGRGQAATQSFDLADQITGLDETLKKSSSQLPSIQDIEKADMKNDKISSHHFFKTLKEVLMSKEERRKFFRFLFK